MPDSPIKHPDKDQLVAFGLGKLDSDEAEKIADHLDSCHDCSETIVNLQDDTFVSLVRRAPSPNDSRDGEQLASNAHERAVDVTVDSSSGATEDTSGSTELPSELRNHPRYEILELIGRGGMGDVYKAQHKVMNRVVALKVIKPELVRNEAAVARFQREVQAAAQLHHGKIVTAHDAEQAGNLHYLVMEFVDGVNLDEVVRDRGALPVAEACNYVQQAAEGLQHAHEHGMVHRDIKPHNLMLSPNGQVRILDFGLAGFATESALIDADSPDAGDDATTLPHLTTMGSVMGTPDYIAPEQARDAHSADIRADIYSLGCTLYYLLTGEPPHKSDSVVEKLKAHAEQEPEAIESIRVDVPDDLAQVVRRMMAKDPSERFQTPEEVADALAPFVDQHRTDGGDAKNGQSSVGAATGPLRFAYRVLIVAGWLSIAAAILAVGNRGWITFQYPEWCAPWLTIGSMLSLPIGLMMLCAAAELRKLRRWPFVVCITSLGLLPLNPTSVAMLPLMLWLLRFLRRIDVRSNFESDAPPVVFAERGRTGRHICVATSTLMGATLLGFIIHFGTNSGQLIIEVDDPDLTVKISRSGRTMRLLEHGDTRITFLPSGNYKITIPGDDTGVEVSPNQVEITRGMHRFVTIRSLNTKGDRKRLQGAWIAESGINNGKPIPADQIGIQRAVFAGSKLSVEMPRGLKGEGHYQLVESTNPKQIGIFVSGENKGARGVYKLEGDKLTLCADLEPGGDLPKDFAAPAGSTFDLIVLRRQVQSSDPSDRTDQELIQGKWKRVALTDNGEEPSLEDRTERFMTFTGDEFTGPQQHQPKPGKFSLDPTASPKQIDLHFPSGPNSYIHIRGIYRLEGDRLTIFQATDWTASKRPTSFEPKLGDKRSLLVFERVRVSDRELLQGAWTATALELAGQKAPQSAFEGKRMMFSGDLVSRFGKVNQIRQFRLNPTTNPKQIDIGASVEGEFSQCIYELDGHKLRLCLPQKTEYPRPTEFDTEGTLNLCVTLQRAELTEVDKLQGTWKAVALEADGQDAPEPAYMDKYMVIRGERISAVGKLGEVEPFLDTRDFRIDPTASPNALDISNTGDGKFAEFSQSIYELNGDTLRICFSQQSDAPRPKSFDTTGTRYFCFTLKRVELAD